MAAAVPTATTYGLTPRPMTGVANIMQSEPPMTPSNPKGTGAPSPAWTDAEVEAAARALAEHAYGQRGMVLFPEDWNRIRRSSMDGMRAALSTIPPVSVPSREAVARIIDPESWAMLDGHAITMRGRITTPGTALQQRIVGKSLAKADGITALFTAPQSE